jgi:hypothetical protein
VKAATRGAELGGVGRPNAIGFSGGAARVGRCGVGERADRWGACVGEGRERRRRGWKSRIIEENVFYGICQRRAWAKRANKGNGSLWKR